MLDLVCVINAFLERLQVIERFERCVPTGYALAESDLVDVLVMDEAHRIRASSATPFTPKAKQSGGRRSTS